MKLNTLIGSGVIALLSCSILGSVAIAADPNPAMNAPDELAWKYFVEVTKPAAAADNNNVVFETWASDGDTFPLTLPARFPSPGAPSPKSLVVRALERFAPPSLEPHVLPGGTEETRRNRAAFDFIVDNNLNSISGLKAAFAAGKDIVFPIDAIEVKANWIPVAPNMNSAEFYINTDQNGKSYALLSLHIISKNVPNWTWATFEHQSNAGRCDFTGCRDSFGAAVPLVQAATSTGGQYPPCAKTPALRQMMTDAKLASAFSNYCLKGSQADFVTPTGLPIILGDSVTERGFANTSSCMTCHARASVNAAGNTAQGAGFLQPPIPALCPTPGPCSPNGAPDPSWFWNNPGTPNQSRKNLLTDFVWAIPLMTQAQ